MKYPNTHPVCIILVTSFCSQRARPFATVPASLECASSHIPKQNRESGLSHDQGLTWPRNTHSSPLHAQPALDRPSLFAGMEPDEDDDPERVRILSTLAASRPPSKRASTRARARRGRGNSWQFKALLVLMGLGIVGLLVGFAMVLAQGHPQARLEAAPEPMAPAVAVQAKAVAPAASVASLPTQTAVIEDLAPTALTPVSTVAAASPLAALNAAPAAAPDQPQAKVLASHSPDQPVRVPTPAAAESHRVIKATPPPLHTDAHSRKPETKRGQDADVALLEAMFTHSRATRTDGDKQRLCAQQPQMAGCAKPR